jgi:NDP-sugar pyrophosphorylase family protein
MSGVSPQNGSGPNVLILAGGQSDSNADDGNYPLCLAEINGAPLIQRLVHACKATQPSRFVVAFRKSDIDSFHLDNVMEVLTPGATIVSGEKDTRGAACTALLAIGYIDNDHELLIVNGNELIDVDYQAVLASFRGRQLTAGTITFPSIHPRYSYVRLSDDDLVVEAAEKRPISGHATAGFYWFARGRDFVRAAEEMIHKDASVNGIFYICPALNELILEQARIGVYLIQPDQYHPLKTARQIIQERSADKGWYQ